MAALAGSGGLTVPQAFVRSLTINVLNPKALTTWVAILSLFPTAEAGIADILLLGLVAMLIGLAIHLAYAIAFSTARAARIYQGAAPWINLTVATFFCVFAMRLGYGLFS
jgi:threonine/homoserine/homoserine lactone efflux protein